MTASSCRDGHVRAESQPQPTPPRAGSPPVPVLCPAPPGTNGTPFWATPAPFLQHREAKWPLARGGTSRATSLGTAGPARPGGGASRCHSHTCAVRGGPHKGGQHLHRGGGVGVSSQPFLHLLAEALGHLLEGLLGEPHVVQVLVHLKGAERAGGERDGGDLGMNPAAGGRSASKGRSSVPGDSFSACW